MAFFPLDSDGVKGAEERAGVFDADAIRKRQHFMQSISFPFPMSTPLLNKRLR